MGWLKQVASGVVQPIAGIFSKREERKRAKESGEAKLAMAKQAGEQAVTLTDAEWEAISKKNEAGTWKDEYLTVIITSPLVGLLLGGVWLAFTGDARLLTGVQEGLKAIKETGVDMGELMYIVVLAGVGLKLWRGK